MIDRDSENWARDLFEWRVEEFEDSLPIFIYSC